MPMVAISFVEIALPLAAFVVAVVVPVLISLHLLF
jgi:hypothetical protein